MRTARGDRKRQPDDDAGVDDDDDGFATGIDDDDADTTGQASQGEETTPEVGVATTRPGPRRRKKKKGPRCRSWISDSKSIFKKLHKSVGCPFVVQEHNSGNGNSHHR